MRVEGRTTGRLGPFDYSEGRTATVLSHHMKSLQKDRSASDISKDRAYVAPTGTIYVSENVLKGVLPQVLDEILTTRAMLKKAAKEYKKKVSTIATTKIGAKISKGEMGIVNWAWIGADLVFFW